MRFRRLVLYAKRTQDERPKQPNSAVSTQALPSREADLPGDLQARLLTQPLEYDFARKANLLSVQFYKDLAMLTSLGIAGCRSRKVSGLTW